MSLLILSFAEAKQPSYKERKAIGYVEFGDKNDYPNYLLDLYNKSAKHGAIIRNKAKYIYGNGFKTESGNESDFIEKCYGFAKKITLDIEVFGGAYLEIIWSQLGRTVVEINHVDFLKIRTNKDNTQFWFKEDWAQFSKVTDSDKVFNAFNPSGSEASQILFLKEYRPGIKAYPLPSYISALNFIEADIEVSKHVLSNASTGFAPSKLITLPNGEPTEDEKRDVTKNFEKTYTGSGGKKFILNFVNNISEKPIIDDLGASDMTKEDFTAVDNLIQTNIFAGHEVTSAALFGIATAGKLGLSSELKDAYDIFKNTYANDKQMFIEKVVNLLAFYSGVQEKFTIIPVNPIGLQLTFADLIQFAPKEYLFEVAGIDITKYGITSTEAPTLGTTNEALRSLTGRQHQQLLRIIKQVGQGKLTKEAATVMLKSALGLNDNEIQLMIGIDDIEVQMSAQDEVSIFAKFGESKSDYKILATRSCFEEHQAFADVTQSESNVLDLIAKDKRITPEIIAGILILTVSRVNDIINAAISKNYIDVKETSIGKGDLKNVVIERKLTAPLAKIVEDIKPKTTAYLVKYSYEWLQEIPSSERNTSAHPSREFCKALMRLDKVYSRSEIEQISGYLGYSVFDRRGGWWNDSGDIKAHCRHRWFSQVVIRK